MAISSSQSRSMVGLQTVTSAEMSGFVDLIYKVAGIRIPLQKTTLISNRIRRRLKATGIDSYSAYLTQLQKLPFSDPEWDAFLQEITTHETYLFRDPTQWAWLRNKYLPTVSPGLATPAQPLRVWSAAASTGAEAYSIAACANERWSDLSKKHIQIVGTDIGCGALQEAEQAIYGERAIKLVPDNLRRLCFDHKPGTSVWQAKPRLKSVVEFRQHNLIEPLRERPFDLIYLKNVLIYFDTESKEVVLKHLRTNLKPGGFLVAGPAEGVSELLPDMKRIESWLFQKT